MPEKCLRTSSWIIIHRIQFLSSQMYFCPQKFIKCVLSTIYHVYIIHRQQKDYRTHLQASDELFSTELNFYPQNRIFIHTNLFLSTKSYKIATWSCAYHSRSIPDGRESRVCIYKHQANYFPQNRIFIHRVQFLSTYPIILIHRWEIWFKCSPIKSLFKL